MLKFIDVINISRDKGIETNRKCSFSISDKRPDELVVLGVLHHNSNITFDKQNAQKLVDFLQKNIIDK